MIQRISQLTEYRDFIPLNIKVDYTDLLVIGLFPYEVAMLHSRERKHMELPNTLVDHINDALEAEGRSDNKQGIVVKDLSFNKRHFAYQWKDGWVKIGKISEIVGYANKILHLKTGKL